MPPARAQHSQLLQLGEGFGAAMVRQAAGREERVNAKVGHQRCCSYSYYKMQPTSILLGQSADALACPMNPVWCLQANVQHRQQKFGQMVRDMPKNSGCSGWQAAVDSCPIKKSQNSANSSTDVPVCNVHLCRQSSRGLRPGVPVKGFPCTLLQTRNDWEQKTTTFSGQPVLHGCRAAIEAVGMLHGCRVAQALRSTKQSRQPHRSSKSGKASLLP